MKRKPEWLRIKIQTGSGKKQVEDLLARLSLNTVCREAKCPNLMECFSRRTATFMILGNTCTRNCSFCSVQKGIPEKADPEEPAKIGNAVRELVLKHAVITSVTRDDLSDGGAEQFVKVVEEIRKQSPGTTIEVLIPDFKGNIDALLAVIQSKPEILAHNIETVPRLYKEVREMANYEQSLKLLENVKKYSNEILTKSGLMAGLGEDENEVLNTMKDLRKADCDIITIGQYLSPTQNHRQVVEYVHPDKFENYRIQALKLGFRYAASGPFVRSSYRADEALEQMNL